MRTHHHAPHRSLHSDVRLDRLRARLKIPGRIVGEGGNTSEDAALHLPSARRYFLVTVTGERTRLAIGTEATRRVLHEIANPRTRS